MIRWLIERQLANFERRWHYPMDYARALLRASRAGFWRFARVMPLAAWRDGVPPAAWHAAKLVAVRAEDCGPCTQLVVDMARADGVADALLCAVLRDDDAQIRALDADTALAAYFARCWTTGSPGLAEAREALRQRFGERGLASLALAMSGARLFPMIKSALGHGQACQRVQVGSEAMAPTPLRPPRLGDAGGPPGAAAGQTAP
jgi:alkylhydroperoxidase family enzyme